MLLSPGAGAENAAHGVRERVVGHKNASRFEFIEKPSSDGNDWFEIRVVDNRIVVTGNSPVALSKGAYAYIQKNNYGVITWEGTNVAIPDQLQNKEHS